MATFIHKEEMANEMFIPKNKEPKIWSQIQDILANNLLR